MTSTPKYLRRVRVEVERDRQVVFSMEEGLRIAFDIYKQAQSDSRSSTVRLYNLSRASESLVEQRGALVRVEAGYGTGDHLGLVGEAQTDRVASAQSGLDRVTTLTVRPPRPPAVVARAYQGTFRLETIVRDLLRAMDLPLGDVQHLRGIVVDEFSAVGEAWIVLQDLLKKRRIEPYVEDGVVQFARLWYDDTPLENALQVNEATGLVGSPSLTSQGRVKARMLLNTDLRLRQLVIVQSQQLSETIRVASISHHGDTWSGAFVTEIEGEPFVPDPLPVPFRIHPRGIF